MHLWPSWFRFFNKNERWNYFDCVHCSVSLCVFGRSASTWSSAANNRLHKLVPWCLTLSEISAGACVRMAETSGECFTVRWSSCWSSRWRAVHLPYGVNMEYRGGECALCERNGGPFFVCVKAPNAGWCEKLCCKEILRKSWLSKLLQARTRPGETFFGHFGREGAL